ncbi:hypothetical protein [Paenibacillus favisporus]
MASPVSMSPPDAGGKPQVCLSDDDQMSSRRSSGMELVVTGRA